MFLFRNLNLFKSWQKMGSTHFKNILEKVRDQVRKWKKRAERAIGPRGRRPGQGGRRPAHYLAQKFVLFLLLFESDGYLSTKANFEVRLQKHKKPNSWLCHYINTFKPFLIDITFKNYFSLQYTLCY